MYRLIAVLLFMFCIGCATSRYDLNLSGQYSKYSEPINNGHPDPSLSRTDYKADGSGLQLGIMETTSIFFAEFGVLYHSHVNQQVTLNSGESSEVKLSRFGPYLKFGINLWWFRPYFVTMNLNHNFRTDSTNILDQLNDGSLTASGLGLGFIYPFTNSTGLYVSYERLVASEFSNLAGSTTDHSFDYGENISIGLTIYLGTLQGTGEEQPESINWP